MPSPFGRKKNQILGNPFHRLGHSTTNGEYNTSIYCNIDDECMISIRRSIGGSNKAEKEKNG